MATLGCRSACAVRASTTSRTSPATVRAVPQDTPCELVAIWSLRERPARSRPADVGTGPLNRPALECGVDVLVIGGRAKADPTVGRELTQGGQHRGEALVVEQAGLVQHPGVSS